MEDSERTSRVSQLLQDSKKAKTRSERINILSNAFDIDPQNVILFGYLAFALEENESVKLGAEEWFHEDVVKEWHRLKIERKVDEIKSTTPRTQARGGNYYTAKSSEIPWHVAHPLPLRVSKLSHHVDGNPIVQRFRQKLMDTMTDSSWQEFYDDVSSYEDKGSDPSCCVGHLRHIYMAISLMFMDTKIFKANNLDGRVKFEASKTGSDYPYLGDAERELTMYLKLCNAQDTEDAYGIQLDQVYFFAAACLLRRQGRWDDACLLFEDFEYRGNIFYDGRPYQSLESMKKSNFEFEKYVISEHKRAAKKVLKVASRPRPPTGPRRSSLSTRSSGYQGCICPHLFGEIVLSADNDL